jgi:general secretion pathway protein E
MPSLPTAIVAAAEAPVSSRSGATHKGDTHPIIVIAEQRWKSLLPPHRMLDLEHLTQWLAKWCGLQYMHVDPLKIEVMSISYATRFRILPVEVNRQRGGDRHRRALPAGWEAEMMPILRKDIRRVIANPDDITRFQVEFYNLAKSIKGAMNKGEVAGGASNFEQLVELGKGNKQFDANDQHIVTIVDWLWQYAFEQRASDIHIEPRRDLGIVRFRIDGVLHQVYQIPMTVLAAMTSRIKILGRMDVIEKRRPQDGRIKTRTPDGQEVELRLSTLPTAFGEKLVMRIFDPEVLVRDFSELGFAPEDQTRWKRCRLAAQRHHPGHRPHRQRQDDDAVLDAEAPGDAGGQCLHPRRPDRNGRGRPSTRCRSSRHRLGFAEGMRALMRQDPDIIMVGEIRDLETADMAIQAALTGHLVLSTLHTNDAPSAITRLLDLGVPSYLLSATVLGVMAQRLVRTLCPHCKQPGGMRAEDEAAWNALVAPWKSSKPAQLYHPAGCLDCRMTGYKGRVGIYEIMRWPRPWSGRCGWCRVSCSGRCRASSPAHIRRSGRRRGRRRW